MLSGIFGLSDSLSYEAVEKKGPLSPGVNQEIELENSSICLCVCSFSRKIGCVGVVVVGGGGGVVVAVAVVVVAAAVVAVAAAVVVAVAVIAVAAAGGGGVGGGVVVGGGGVGVVGVVVVGGGVVVAVVVVAFLPLRLTRSRLLRRARRICTVQLLIVNFIKLLLRQVIINVFKCVWLWWI